MIYPDAIGVMAYLIIALIPFAMMWISQGSARMAAISGLIVIGFVAFFLPANYMIAAYLCIITTTAATAYGLYKGSF